MQQENRWGVCTNASDTSQGRPLAQPTMNFSALGSRSLARKGEGSMASNNCTPQGDHPETLFEWHKCDFSI